MTGIVEVEYQEGDRVTAFNAREWEEAGYDQPDGNAQFFQVAEILDISVTKRSAFGPGGEEIATLRWPDGRISCGHFINLFRKVS